MVMFFVGAESTFAYFEATHRYLGRYGKPLAFYSDGRISLLKHATLGQLFADKSAVPVKAAYQLSVLMERPGAKDVVLKAAQNLVAKGESGRSPAAM